MWGPGRSGWQGPLDAIPVLSLPFPNQSRKCRRDFPRLPQMICPTLSLRRYVAVHRPERPSWQCARGARRDISLACTWQEGRIIWITPGAGRIPSTPQQREDMVDNKAEPVFEIDCAGLHEVDKGPEKALMMLGFATQSILVLDVIPLTVFTSASWC